MERKRDLPDLETQDGKGRLVRALLALANSTSAESPAYLIFGVADERQGGEVVGIPRPLDPDTVSRLLHNYTQPIPDVNVVNRQVDGRLVTVCEVRWTESWPYYATRDVGDVLSASKAYHRVGATIAEARPAEVESWIRRKLQRVGSAAPSESLRAGFVERGDFGGPRGPVLRIENRSGEAISDVWVVFDLRSAHDPQIFRRAQSLGGLKLEAGTSREVECDLRHDLWKANVAQRPLGKIMDRWIDVTAHVQYRDEYGYMRSLQFVTQLF